MPYFTWDDDTAQHEPFIRCEKCNADLCTAEEGDTLDLIVAVAADHATECPGVPAPDVVMGRWSNDA